MSDIKRLAVRVSRELSAYRFVITVNLSDGTASEVVSNSPHTVAHGSMGDIRPALARIMSGAHPGAVAVITLPATGETATLAAPGGAFDGRALTPPPPVGNRRASTAGDLRALSKGVRLPVPTRSLLVSSEGLLIVRTFGSPDELQAPFYVAAGQQIPISVVEIGAFSTAAVIGLF